MIKCSVKQHSKTPVSQYSPSIMDSDSPTISDMIVVPSKNYG